MLRLTTQGWQVELTCSSGWCKLRGRIMMRPADSSQGLVQKAAALNYATSVDACILHTYNDIGWCRKQTLPFFLLCVSEKNLILFIFVVTYMTSNSANANILDRNISPVKLKQTDRTQLNSSRFLCIKIGYKKRLLFSETQCINYYVISDAIGSAKQEKDFSTAASFCATLCRVHEIMQLYRLYKYLFKT